MTNTQKEITGKIINTISTIKGNQFVGIKNYLSKKSGEISNVLVNCGFSYENAIKKDVEKLQSITEKEVQLIALEYKQPVELIQQAIDKLLAAFLKNMNKATQSNQSKGQELAYVKIADSIKMNIETGLIYVYALSVKKTVIKKGEYKVVNSRPLTIAQNNIKKALNFSTANFRNFVLSPENFGAVKAQGEEFIF